MTKTLRLGKRPRKHDARSVRPGEIGTIIRAVNRDPSLSDLADGMQVILATALDPVILQGLRWSDVHFDDHHLIARSARTLHTLSIPLIAPILGRLRARRERYPDEEYVFPFDCLRQAQQKIRELSSGLLGREVTLEDVRDATLKGWGRYSPKDLL